MMRIFSLAVCVIAIAAGRLEAELIGITGDGATTPSSLYSLSLTDATSTFIMSLGNGDDGETIGFNPSNGLLYHASGISDGDRFWESIDTGTSTIVSSTQFTGPDVTDENLSMTYNSATGTFLVADRDDVLFDTALGGSATGIGTTPENLKGLAFVGGTLYGAAVFSDTLYTLDPSNGAVVSSLSVTVDGGAIDGMNGLALNPEDDVLWGVFRQAGGIRLLGTLDPTTGIGTSVGTLSDNFAGIAFTSVPEPSSRAVWAIGACVAGIVSARRRRRAVTNRDSA
ncbi:hypothetical protein [Fuerstiella marisgermanici]|uniref:Ice-binding protein C-terminal domain-containing protein n=1 Tax=Fuerstiella marisgermanici TaxID=1891926 RepID=A0A1P8WQC2_9PLAN|nr:hypothetical protein [Fuerstiella marisgermanici]APZ96250.1 hypothetical protein Fuma_05918 [Fuerstiella marisgermanici]